MLTDGKQIAAARQLLGWSQGDLAERAGISKPSVIRIEKDIMSVKHDVQAHVQQAFENNNIEFLDHRGVRENNQTLKRYRGQTGFRDFYDDLYETARDVGGDICLFNGISAQVTKWLGEDYVNLQKDRMTKIETSFNFRVIVEEGDAVFFGAQYCTYRWFPRDLFNEKTIYIYGPKVAFITFSDNDVEVICVKQQELAECQRLFFNLAWSYIGREVTSNVS